MLHAPPEPACATPTNRTQWPARGPVAQTDRAAVSFCEAALPVKSDVISLQEGDRCVLQLSLQQLSSARFLTLLSALISGSAWAAGARGSCDGAGAPSNERPRQQP